MKKKKDANQRPVERVVIPSSVLICGAEWDIKLNPKEGRGWFNGAKFEIGIGTKHSKDVPMIFLHEVIEAIITDRGHRYKIFHETNEKLLFSFNHAEFENIVRDIALALRDVYAVKG